MGTAKGNGKYISDADQLWEYFEKYTEEVKSNPYKVKDWVGKDGFEVKREKERPLTLEGFSSYCFRNHITGNIHDYFGNKNGKYEDYSDICRAIKEIIRQDQIEGGMAGMYNPSITQRLNGLVEKTESKNENDNKHSGDLNITMKID